jgi:hypothetical protein
MPFTSSQNPQADLNNTQGSILKQGMGIQSGATSSKSAPSRKKTGDKDKSSEFQVGQK